VDTFVNTTSNNWIVLGRCTGNVVTMSFTNTTQNNASSPGITIPADYRPSSTIRVNAMSYTGETTGFDINTNGTIGGPINGNFSAGAGGTATWIINNVAAAHLVTAPPVDFSSQITGSLWTGGSNQTALYNPTTGLVVISLYLPNGSLAVANLPTIPDKYLPIVDTVYGQATWDGLTSGSYNMYSCVKRSDKKFHVMVDGADFASSASKPTVMSIAYYVEPEAGVYVISRIQPETPIAIGNTSSTAFSSVIPNFTSGYCVVRMRLSSGGDTGYLEVTFQAANWGIGHIQNVAGSNGSFECTVKPSDIFKLQNNNGYSRIIVLRREP
jgi:hypothetical protein